MIALVARLVVSKGDRVRVWSPVVRKVHSKHPRGHYEKCPFFSDLDVCFSSRENLGDVLYQSERVIKFMDETGWRPSKAWTRTFGNNGLIPRGFDHTLLWLDGKGEIVITTEPYDLDDHLPEIEAWAVANGWKVLLQPRGAGIWNTCRPECLPDCDEHTRMVILRK